MTITADERRRMLAVPLCGDRVIARLESIGVRRLSDLANREPDELVLEVNLEAGRPIWWPPMATRAMANLVAAANQAQASADRGPAQRLGLGWVKRIRRGDLLAGTRVE